MRLRTLNVTDTGLASGPLTQALDRHLLDRDLLARVARLPEAAVRRDRDAAE